MNYLYPKIAILGGGNMAWALVSGLISQNYPSQNITVYERDSDKCRIISDKFKINSSYKMDNSLANFEIILLAVKPQDLKNLCQSIVGKIANPLIITIAAGVLINNISKWLEDTKNKLHIVRVMPNTPAAVGKGVSAAFANINCTQSDREQTQIILTSIGKYLWLENEHDLDAVTAISGSGPAYFFYFCECLEQAGEKLGLSPEIARELTKQTLIGTGYLCEKSLDSISTLREKVTSKGGTTEQALLKFNLTLPEIVNTATRAACDKSIELSKIII